MARTARRAFFYLAAALIVLLSLVWLILAAPLFSKGRTSLIEDVLTRQIGQPVHIKEDARVLLGFVSRIHASGVEIPSVTMADVMLAELNFLELDIDLVSLLSGEVVLNNLVVDGLQVRLLQAVDGTNSWSERPPPSDTAPEKVDEKKTDTDLLGFLKEHEFAFSDVGIEIDNDKTGFEFSFQLENLKLTQGGADTVPTLTGRGELNGHPVTIDGSFPTNNPFAIHSDIAGIVLDYVGTGTGSDKGTAHEADLNVEIASFGSLLDILKLDRVTDGQGALRTGVSYDSGTIRLNQLDIQVEMDSGAGAVVKGSVDNLSGFQGVALDVSSRLHPEGQPPAKAQKFSDIKLTDITARIVGDAEGFEFETLNFTTNALTPELKSVGPVSIDEVVRTEQGQLAMRGINLLAGPEDAPFLDANGNIENLLELENIEIAGVANLPASLVLAKVISHPEAFGRVAVEFAADDSAGYPSISQLSARTSDTELWSLLGNMQVGDIIGLSDIDFSLEIEIADKAEFIAALGGASSTSGSMGIGAFLKGNGRDFETSLALKAGASDLKAEWQTRIAEGAPTLNGLISSSLIDLDDMADAIADLIKLKKTLETQADDGSLNDASQGKPPKLQPLILPEMEDGQEVTDKQVSADAKEPRKLQPLILPEADLERQSGPDTADGAEPAGEPDLADFFDLPKLMKASEVALDIKLEKISGQEGISKVDSSLAVTDGQASFGPLDVSYGGGNASVSAGMDFVKTPEFVTVSGSTGGWDFGKIMDAVGAGIPAYGILSAKFNVTGRYTSLDAFTDTMTGNAHVSLTGGKIGTSLLELAGLGVLPWLFSKEAGQGYTTIVCVEAPLSIKSGRVASNSIVAETQAVQVVVKGTVDLKNEVISLRAEPRPVGKALSRSAWPVEITGPLKSPSINVKPGSAPAKPTAGGGLFAKKPSVKKNRVPCRPDAQQLE